MQGRGWRVEGREDHAVSTSTPYPPPSSFSPDAIVNSFVRTTTESKYPGFPPAAGALRAGFAGAAPFFACMRVS
jgi:hypothetical protein